MTKKHFHIALIAFCGLLAMAPSLYAAEPGSEPNLVGQTSLLVFQLSAILFATWLGGLCFAKWRLPSVLGEIIAGVIIGPYLLGKIPFWGFENGLFPSPGSFPVSVELYSFSTVAAIILLFSTGLETDLEAFLQFSFAGSIVALSGVIFSFLAGDFLGIYISENLWGTHFGFFHPIPLFLGVTSVATSVGISARILTEKHKMNSPEGVTILSAAVIDDVLGIIVLAIVIGMAKSGHVEWQKVSLITVKALSIWFFFTCLGLIYAHSLSKRLKMIKNRETMVIISFALTLLLSGIFEKSGLAMIIGAYIMGLTLSKTDLSFVIREKMEMLQKFFVPIFFCVMGMLINLEKMASPQLLTFGLIYVVFAVLSKLVGCGFPALFLNFNWRGALRVGVGMIPRGEVALIVAGVGLSSGIINDEVFNIAMIMTFFTTLITPPILDKLLDSPKPVLRKEPPVKELRMIHFAMPNPETAELLLRTVLEAFEAEGFFVHNISQNDQTFHLRKNRSFIMLTYTPQELVFDCVIQDMAFIHTLFYEVIAQVEHYMQQLESISEAEKIGRKIFAAENGATEDLSEKREYLFPQAVETHLKGGTKREVLEELVDILVRSGQIQYSKRDCILRDLWKRETTMSTGMQDGIALPHTKTACVDRLTVAVGISKTGVDFDSLDKKPSKIFIMTLVPEKNPESYLRVMSEVSKFLISEKNREEVLQCRTQEELFKLLDRYL